MHILAEAEKALARHWRAVLTYMLATILISIIYSLTMGELERAVPREVTPKPFWYVLATLSSDLLSVALAAALQSVFFAFVGHELDKPLWKYEGWRDGLKRFFTLWFMLNLVYVTAARLPAAVPEEYQGGLFVVTRFVLLALIALGVPFAACIIHGGRLLWKDVPGMLLPFFRLPQFSLVAVALGFLQFSVIATAMVAVGDSVRESPWYWAVVNVPLVLLECLAFAVMWLTCIHYREVAADFEDDDFDF